MPWIRLEDNFTTHPKVIGLSDAAFRLYVHGLCYANSQKTDGLIPRQWLTGGRGKVPKAAAELVEAKLWTVVDHDFEIHDFLNYQRSRMQIETGRAKTAEARAEAGRLGGLAKAANAKQTSSKPLAHGPSKDLANPSSKVLAPTQPNPTQREPEPPSAVAPVHARSLVRPVTNWAHGEHEAGFCDWMCLPADLVDQFANRLIAAGTARDLPSGQTLVRIWARNVRSSGIVPTGRMYDFWNAQWTLAHGSSRPVEDGAAGRAARTNQRLDRFVENG